MSSSAAEYVDRLYYQEVGRKTNPRTGNVTLSLIPIDVDIDPDTRMVIGVTPLHTYDDNGRKFRVKQISSVPPDTPGLYMAPVDTTKVGNVSVFYIETPEKVYERSLPGTGYTDREAFLRPLFNVAPDASSFKSPAEWARIFVAGPSAEDPVKIRERYGEPFYKRLHSDPEWPDTPADHAKMMDAYFKENPSAHPSKRGLQPDRFEPLLLENFYPTTPHGIEGEVRNVFPYVYNEHMAKGLPVPRTIERTENEKGVIAQRDMEMAHAHRLAFIRQLLDINYRYIRQLIGPKTADKAIFSCDMKFNDPISLWGVITRQSGPVYISAFNVFRMLRNGSVAHNITYTMMSYINRRMHTFMPVNRTTLLWDMANEAINPTQAILKIRFRQLTRLICLAPMTGHAMFMDIKFRDWDSAPTEMKNAWERAHGMRTPVRWVDIRINDSSESLARWADDARAKFKAKSPMDDYKIIQLLLQTKANAPKLVHGNIAFDFLDSGFVRGGLDTNTIEDPRILFFRELNEKIGPFRVSLQNIQTPQFEQSGCAVHAIFGMHFLALHPLCIRPPILALPRIGDYTSPTERDAMVKVRETITEPFQPTLTSLSSDEYRLYIAWCLMSNKLLDVDELSRRVKRKITQGLGCF